MHAGLVQTEGKGKPEGEQFISDCRYQKKKKRKEKTSVQGWGKDGKLNWLQKNGYDLARKIGKVALDSGGWKPRVAAIPSKRQGEGELTCGCEAGSLTRRLHLNHHSPGGLHLGREAAECMPAPGKAHSCPDPPPAP